MAKNKEEEKKEEVSASSRLSTILKDNEDKHFNNLEDSLFRISTGSLMLDIATRQLTPSLVRLCGMNNEGKSPEALEIARNYLNTVPKSRGLLVLAEGRLSEQNKERCGLEFVTDPQKWKEGNIFVLRTNLYEFFIDTLRDLVKNNPEKNKYVVIIDSIDGLILEDDSGKSASESAKVSGPQLLSKKLLQSMSLSMFLNGHLVVMISQMSANIKLDPYAKTTRVNDFAGGNALLHWADFIISVQPSYQGDYILDNPNGKLNDGKSKPIGKWCHVILEKSTIETSRKQKISYPIKFGRKPCAIWVEYEIIQYLLSFDLAKKAGAWITVSDKLIEDMEKVGQKMEKQHNGMDKFREYLENNPELTKVLYNYIKEALTF